MSVTNRKLCPDNFLDRVERIAAAQVDAIILREKDLSEPEYDSLAMQCLEICEKHHVKLILHSFIQTAMELHLPIQLPIRTLLALPEKVRGQFPAVGASVHSQEEAIQAQKYGADWLIAGHIFPTSCKLDLPPRGLEFLRSVCGSVTIPVYAIGGITMDRLNAVRQAGAAGCCVMSEWMQCKDPEGIIKTWKGAYL